ncbi:sugar ABC transporter substrate-binding protein [Paenibacillus alkaliterrae]|uniref:ABC transporter substrate-binding protein n=1 Tax=Paenibacillus alkaliterrae TaxID=320909 RepID=UPI001F203181|nr:sugar ABC transporter substrate-binding protein [Paenibacillus alkaliterrae]MCF2937150.1 sugar ABC transporter substrate-binding protein [Paenibacillus alkaliterrae]
MHKVMKAFLLTFISTVLIFGLAACGSSNNNSQSENAVNEPSNNQAANEPAAQDEKKEPVEIRFTWWGDTKRNEVYNAIADRFEEEYPHITVKREFGGWGDYWDRLTTQIAGGNAPDVVSMHQFYVSDYARRDALVDLETVVSSGELNLVDYPEAAINSGRINDTLYMVPKGVTMPGWAYNTALFDELGVAYPDMNWTWDDFVAKVTEIKEKSGSKNIWGAPDGGGGQPQPNFRYFLRQSGQDLYTEDGKLGFTKETLVEWWTMWDGLRQKGAIPDATTGTEYENAPLEQNMFVKGLTAITQIPANQIYLYQQQFKSGEIRMVRMPRKEGGENGEYIEGAYLSITKKSEHPKEAAMFINFFINSEKSLELFKVEQGSPASTKMSEFVKPLLDPAQQRAVAFIQETLPYSSPAVYAPLGAAEIEQAFKDNSTSIAFGKLTIEQAADGFMKTAESVLK